METHDSLFEELECENLYNMKSFPLTILGFLVDSILTIAVAIKEFHTDDRNYFRIDKLVMSEKRWTGERSIPKGAEKRKNLLDTKQRLLDCYVVSILLYRSECWTISLQMRKKTRSNRNVALQKGTENKGENGKERTLILHIRKRQLKFLEHMARVFCR